MEIERESIFISAIRSFCRMFFAVCGIFLALFVISLVYSLISTTTVIEEKTTLTYLPDANGNREIVSLSAPVVLQLNIHGVIGEPKVLDSDIVQNILLDSRTGLLQHDRVKAVLIHMNTPGGTVVDSDNIYQMVKQYKEKYKVPVFVYVDGLCASGGMYISSAADQIYASPSAIVGSVGVRMGPFFNVYDTLTRVGIQARTLTEGLDKDMMNPTRPWKEGEDQSLKAVGAFFYERFVNIVTEARPRLDRTKLIQEYGAKIFDPVEAEKLGYIDVANSTREAALAALLNEAKIDPAKPYQVVELTPKPEWLSNLFAQSPLVTGRILHKFDIGETAIRDQFAYLYQASNQ